MGETFQWPKRILSVLDLPILMENSIVSDENALPRHWCMSLRCRAWPDLTALLGWTLTDCTLPGHFVKNSRFAMSWSANVDIDLAMINIKRESLTLFRPRNVEREMEKRQLKRYFPPVFCQSIRYGTSRDGDMDENANGIWRLDRHLDSTTFMKNLKTLSLLLFWKRREKAGSSGKCVHSLRSSKSSIAAIGGSQCARDTQDASQVSLCSWKTVSSGCMIWSSHVYPAGSLCRRMPLSCPLLWLPLQRCHNFIFWNDLWGCWPSSVLKVQLFAASKTPELRNAIRPSSGWAD